MFHRSSWLRRAGAAVALVISLCAGSVALPHAEGADDFACAPVPVAHDERAHHVGALPAADGADADHCFLCHSLRSFYPAFHVFEQHHETPRAERMHAAPVDALSRVELTLVHGRAPPL